MSWILLILSLAALTIVGTVVFGLIFGRGELTPPADPSVVAANNTAAIEHGHPERVRFEIVHRGYKPEQVDAVIEQLLSQIEEERAKKQVD